MHEKFEISCDNQGDNSPGSWRAFEAQISNMFPNICVIYLPDHVASCWRGQGYHQAFQTFEETSTGFNFQNMLHYTAFPYYDHIEIVIPVK